VGYPRSLVVDREHGGFYHVMSRCVRRAWLCGFDPLTGRSFEHRRNWIEARILTLGALFAAEVYGYAVMSNHYHVVLYIDPRGPATWTPREVARRWIALTPPKRKGRIDHDRIERCIDALMQDEVKLARCRRRLGDLSWFMRFLNEPIARRANREDGCTGRFWEGRFESQALLDVRAVYGCMTYVDLNPIRAAMCTRLEDSAHTSIQRRIEKFAMLGIEVIGERPLAPLSSGAPATQRLGMTERDYLALVDWTGRQVRPDKRGTVPADMPVVLAELVDDGSGDADEWLRMVAAYGRARRRAFGSASVLQVFTETLSRRWRAWLERRAANF
jgi:hypothetical protein